MNNLAISLASLVKSNGGFFKSEKQAAFFKSKCDGDFLIASGEVYGNVYYNEYRFDDKGVYEVEKHLLKSGKFEIVWKRAAEGEMSPQNKKLLAHYKRDLKGLEKRIKAREEAINDYMDEGESMMELYNNSMEADKAAIAVILEHIAELS